jgi:hypothetical protein
MERKNKDSAKCGGKNKILRKKTCPLHLQAYISLDAQTKKATKK